MSQACDYISLHKRVVAFLFHAKKAAARENDSVTADAWRLVAGQITAPALAALNVVTKDLLVLLAPGRTEVRAGSLLRTPWVRGHEAWLRDQLFLTAHPAMLPLVLAYLARHGVEGAALAAAWQRLQEEDAGDRGGGASVSLSGFMVTGLADLPAIGSFVSSFSHLAGAGGPRSPGKSVSSQATVETVDSGLATSVFSRPHQVAPRSCCHMSCTSC